MKLNNKGFAITGILYTLFILFSLTLISIITGLNSRKKIMEKSVETMENKYVYSDCSEIDDLTEAPKTGKYIFTSNGITCYTFLSEGTIIDNNDLTFTTSECNNNKSSLTLSKYCVKE